MSDNFLLDSHKLNFHPRVVADWNEGKVIYPISIEISPSGACNHRCKFCSQSYLGYKNNFIKAGVLNPILSELKEKGVKGVVMAGEGEPLLNPEIIQIINHTKRNVEMDVALSTNATLLDESMSEAILSDLSWIRISLNATDEIMYQAVHGSNRADEFNKILENIYASVCVKRNKKLNVTIGVQYVIFSENSDWQGLINLATKLKDVGVDYFSIKPYSRHPLCSSNIIPCDFSDFNLVKQDLNSLSDEKYKVIIREASISRTLVDKPYKNCLGIPFWAYIDSNLNVWPCLAYLGVETYLFGNLSDQSIREIFEGQHHEDIINAMCNMDITDCRKSCRLDPINEYLWKLKNNPIHVNFI